MAEQTTNQIDLSEIETLVNKRDIKLPKLKEFAKLLNIKITKLKKDDIIKLILLKTYDPARYFNELYDREDKSLKEKEHRDKTGKDYWLHKFTKYKVEETQFLVIVKLHPHQVSNEDNYIITFQHIGCIDKINGKSSMYNGKMIKSESDIEIIKNLCNEKQLKFKEFSRESFTDLDYACRSDLIDEIIGYGSLCRQSYPCNHSLSYIGTDGKTYNIKYAGYRFIREAYLNMCDGDESELPVHFMKKK
jgi:hypothetical protein